MIETLPHHILDALPLSDQDLCSLSLVSRALRDSVAAVRCIRGISIDQRHITCLLHDRYTNMTRLTIRGKTAQAPHVLVPRHAPWLTTLVMRPGWMPDDPKVWATVFHNAPRLTSLKLHPNFHWDNYANDLLTLARVASLGAGQLTHLHFEGSRPNRLRYMAPGCMTAREQDIIPAIVALCTAEPIHLPHLRTLSISGGQAFLAVDAPLVDATIEEPKDATKGWCTVPRLGATARATLETLSWTVPAGLRASLFAFEKLRCLKVYIEDIHTARDFELELEALSCLPSGLVDLTVGLGFDTLMGKDAELRFDVEPLSHLRNLKDIWVVVSFPTPGSTDLVRGLLGVPKCAPLKRIWIMCNEGAASDLKMEYASLLREDADPDDTTMIELMEDIQEREEDSTLITEDVLDLLAAFPSAKVRLAGFHVYDELVNERPARLKVAQAVDESDYE